MTEETYVENKEQANQEQKQSFINPKDLLKLVKEAQNGNEEVKLQLCLAFTPLIKACASKSEVAEALGDDAESIAWLIFLDCIAGLDVEKMDELKPGYFKAVICNRLINYQTKAYDFTNCHLLQDKPVKQDCNTRFEDKIINDMVLQIILESLKPKEKQFIYWRYFEGLSFEKIAALLHKSPLKIWMINRGILRKMRKRYKALASLAD